jgi:small GTP-binding protein
MLAVWTSRMSTCTRVSFFVLSHIPLSFKVILIGDVWVGKTCLLSRYLKNTLPKKVGNTIGVEFATKNVTMKDGATVKAQLWDTAG